MNKLLKKAFDKAAELPDEKQETLGAIILDEMEHDSEWEALLATPESQAFLEKLSKEARADSRAEPLTIEDL